MTVRDDAADVRGWHDYTLRLLSQRFNDHGISVAVGRIDDQHGSIGDVPGELRASSPGAVMRAIPSLTPP